jgi:chromosome segregation ATPase
VSRYQELESRVTAVEERLDEQAGLRASQDRDLANVGEALRAQSGLLKALAATQSEHTYQIGQLGLKLGQLDLKVDRLDDKVGQLDGKVSQLDGKVSQLDQKMDAKFGQVDKRLDQVDERFDQVDERFGQLDQKLDRVNQDVQLIISMLGRPAGGDSPTPA